MPHLLSVNVGLPRDIAWRGKTVRTAIWKTPVQGSRMVRRLNIDGDGQGDLAAHGGEHRAVFVYQIDSYHYWQRELGRNVLTYGSLSCCSWSLSGKAAALLLFETGVIVPLPLVTKITLAFAQPSLLVRDSQHI